MTETDDDDWELKCYLPCCLTDVLRASWNGRDLGKTQTGVLEQAGDLCERREVTRMITLSFFHSPEHRFTCSQI